MKIENIIPKTAYLVESWSCKKIKGIAYDLVINDYGDTKCSLFSSDGKVWRVLKSYNSDKVFYSLLDAEKHAAEQVKEALSFYVKQRDEYNAKIKELEGTL